MPEPMGHFTDSWPVGRTSSRPSRLSKQELARREQALQRAPMFNDVSKRHLKELARATWVREHPAGATIMKEGRTESSFVMVLEGRVRVVRGGRTLFRGTKGDFFGEISLLDPGPRTASVIAETPVTCADLAGQDLRRILAGDATLTMRLLTGLARRFRALEPPRP
jgi:CRP/FNR family transcriptional regulator, cyclic AMP receptor protein